MDVAHNPHGASVFYATISRLSKAKNLSGICYVRLIRILQARLAACLGQVDVWFVAGLDGASWHNGRNIVSCHYYKITECIWVENIKP